MDDAAGSKAAAEKLIAACKKCAGCGCDGLG